MTFEGIGIHRLEGIGQQLECACTKRRGMPLVDAPAPPPCAAAADETPQLSLSSTAIGSHIYNSIPSSYYVGDLDPKIPDFIELNTLLRVAQPRIQRRTIGSRRSAHAESQDCPHPRRT